MVLLIGVVDGDPEPGSWDNPKTGEAMEFSHVYIRLGRGVSIKTSGPPEDCDYVDGEKVILRVKVASDQYGNMGRYVNRLEKLTPAQVISEMERLDA